MAKKKAQAPKVKPPKRKLSVANLTPILLKTFGNYSHVARIFKVTRQSVYEYVKEHSAELGPIVKQARESEIDCAQEGLAYHLKKKEPWSIKLVLETLGKRRGYIKQLELAGADPATGALPIQITLPSNGREMTPPTAAAILPAIVSQHEKQDEDEDGTATAGGDDSAE